MWLTIGILFTQKDFCRLPENFRDKNEPLEGNLKTLEVKFSPLTIFRFPR